MIIVVSVCSHQEQNTFSQQHYCHLINMVAGGAVWVKQKIVIVESSARVGQTQ